LGAASADKPEIAVAVLVENGGTVEYGSAHGKRDVRGLLRKKLMKIRNREHV
jgi:cell division protein FtsI/penicillin-binding protein 2